ncbi:sodium-independent sulfate anion transporter-like [Oppia nitens]|uniref:sodium-independent sulfate anion transporter-like n=1 Tax=Oppia nitens TaxID=1686743 RepID=UPI0023DCBC4A|nr:sodium-independent sulfate anion transporter-like [Oppia nitens]
MSDKSTNHRHNYEKLLGNDYQPKFKNIREYHTIDSDNNENNEKHDDITESGFTLRLEESDDMTLNECCVWFGQRYFTREKLRRRLPFIDWLPRYSLADLKGDIIAGLSVAFTIVPQGLALAVLAGLPAQYGLYTSFMGCFIYALLGSCKDVAVGPTSIMAIIIAPYVMSGGIEYSIILAFMAGCIQLLFGILNLGFIVDFISYPVISSFSSAAAITIAASQLKLLFGMHYSASRFPDTMYKFFHSMTTADINWWDTLMGCLSLLFLIPIQLAKDFRFKDTRNSPKKNTSSSSSSSKHRENWYTFLNGLWVMTVTARNAIVVIVGGFIAALYYQSDIDVDGGQQHRITMTGQIRTGLPPFQLPPFSIQQQQQPMVNNNNTTTTTISADIEFGQIFSDLGTGVFVVALLGLMESVAVAKAFNTNKLDATQEMIAIGMCNILGSCFGAFAATGSFSRSAVNHNSGVRTPFGGVITGSLVLLALSTLAPYFQYIPQTVLATIIITAVIFMLRPLDPFLIWKTNKVDVLPYVSTFFVCLILGLEYGIVAGIATSVMILLYQMARPKVYIVMKSTPDGYPFLYVKPDRSVFFPSIEYMKLKINKQLPDSNELSSKIAVVLDGEHMFRADSTFALGIKNMITSLSDRRVLTIFYNLRKTVFRAVHGVGIPANEFHNCLNESHVYQLIQTHNKCRVLRSQSNVETLVSTMSSTINTSLYHRNEHWISQSTQAY